MAIYTYEANDLKTQLPAAFSYLQGLNINSVPKSQRAWVEASSNYFLVWKRRMFRRVPRRLCLIAPIQSRQEIARTFHDGIGH